MSRYIDADKLKFVIEKNFGHGTITPILQLIDGQPTADVRENVHAEWIFIPIDDSRGRRTGDIGCVCKKCTREIFLPFSKDPYNFCPNCGADMRKGEDNG